MSTEPTQIERIVSQLESELPPILAKLASFRRREDDYLEYCDGLFLGQKEAIERAIQIVKASNA
jgi:hypothetical protein